MSYGIPAKAASGVLPVLPANTGSKQQSRTDGQERIGRRLDPGDRESAASRPWTWSPKQKELIEKSSLRMMVAMRKTPIGGEHVHRTDENEIGRGSFGKIQ